MGLAECYDEKVSSSQEEKNDVEGISIHESRHALATDEGNRNDDTRLWYRRVAEGYVS